MGGFKIEHAPPITDVNATNVAAAGAIITINVKTYGAVGDGVIAADVVTGTDDTAAINAAFNAARALIGADTTSGRNPVRVVFPPGIYVVSSVNATGMRGYGVSVHGAGAKIAGNVAGKAVFDMCHSRFMSVHDLVVVGDKTNVPKCGFQLGYIDGSTSAGKNSLYDCYTEGFFSLSGFYNAGAEETETHNCQFRNQAVTANSFGLVHDPFNHWSIASDHQTITWATDTPASFVDCVHHTVGVIRAAGGVPVWLGSNIGNHRFENSYFQTFNDSGCIIYFDSAITQNYPHGLYMNVLFEGDFTAPGMTSCVKFVRNTGMSPILTDFSFITQDVSVSDEVFECTDAQTGQITLVGADIRIATFSPVPTNGLFNDATEFLVSGRITSKASSGELKGMPSRFVGEIFCSDGDRIVFGAGTYDLYGTLFNGSANSAKITKGEQKWYGQAADTFADQALDDADFTSVNGKRVITQNIRSQTFTLADDTATSFTIPSSTAKTAHFELVSNSGTGPNGTFWVRGTASPAIVNISAIATNLEITGTGALTGTTGTDGKYTIRAVNDGKVYIENRIGSSISFALVWKAALD